MTTSTLTRLAPTQVELQIPITLDELAAAEDRAFRKLVKNAKIPGFRKGKVPRKVFEQAYGVETITHQAIEEVLPAAYAKAVREHDIDPVERPTMEIVEERDGRPARLKATVEVRPDIPLEGYKDVPVSHETVEVTDADVERSLEALARERATAVPADRPARLGDVVTIDYRGTIDGEAFEGGSAEGEVTELVENRFIPGFAAGIAGMSAGDARTVDTRFPDDYGKAELAGKAARFDVTLHEVKELELPALDDTFAKTISTNATLEELRADVKRRLEAIARGRERRAIGNAVMDRLLAAHDFPLPASLVEGEIDQLAEDAASAAAREGQRLEDRLAESQKSMEEFRAELRPEAEARVKATLLIERIAKEEHIVATPTDVQEEFEALARRYGQPVSRIRQALGHNVLSLMDGVVRNKTLDFLIEHARVEASEETEGPAS